MKKYIWFALAALFVVAAGATWYAFTSPTFVAGLSAAAAAALWKALAPVILKRKSPADEQRWRDAVRRGEEWDPIKDRPKER